MIGLLRDDIGEQGFKRCGIVHVAALAPPVHETCSPLVGEIPPAGRRQRIDVEIGEMRECKHMRSVAATHGPASSRHRVEIPPLS
jgi:hypothetical protein